MALPSNGMVHLDGEDLGSMTEDERARLRVEKIGFVFQSFQLMPTLTARENVQVPLELRGQSEAGIRARDLLNRVGLSGREHHYPVQLSGRFGPRRAEGTIGRGGREIEMETVNGSIELRKVR